MKRGRGRMGGDVMLHLRTAFEPTLQKGQAWTALTSKYSGKELHVWHGKTNTGPIWQGEQVSYWGFFQACLPGETKTNIGTNLKFGWALPQKGGVYKRKKPDELQTDCGGKIIFLKFNGGSDGQPFSSALPFEANHTPSSGMKCSAHNVALSVVKRLALQVASQLCSQDGSSDATGLFVRLVLTGRSLEIQYLNPPTPHEEEET